MANSGCCSHEFSLYTLLSLCLTSGPSRLGCVRQRTAVLESFVAVEKSGHQGHATHWQHIKDLAPSHRRVGDLVLG